MAGHRLGRDDAPEAAPLMPLLLLVVFVVVPIIEIWVIVQVNQGYCR